MHGLYDKLYEYSKDDYYPMHMPGHKRNTQMMHMVNPYRLDITEIDDFDNLHQPEGILKELAQRLSMLYGSEKSFPLVNGSTAGNLAGISAATNRGDDVLVARNSHKSVYHAIMLMGLKPQYIYPQIIAQTPLNGGILAKEIELALINNKKIKLVVITSPTYEGVVSDISAIADIVHAHGALLMIDEAHGAHFGFHESFPQSAVTLGADLVIQSLHKTLPALTQSAVLHSNKEELNHKIQRYLAIYESSSPSYLLMAGIDRCISILEEQRNELFDHYYNHLQEFYHGVKALKNLKVVERQGSLQEGVYALDPSKITVLIRNADITGYGLQELLRTKYHIIMEMAAPEYVLGMTSFCDTQEGFMRLSEALLSIDKELTQANPIKIQVAVNPTKPQQVLCPGEAMEQKTEGIKLSDSTGRISAAYISLYPPGTPLLVPGERIDKELLSYLQWIKKEAYTVTGLIGDQFDEIEVVCSQ